MKKFTQEEFINRCRKKHNNYYDYSLSQYTKCYEKIIVICPQHGQFTVTANDHLKGSNCAKCSRQKNTLSLNDFITRAVQKHGSYYDYSKVEYKNINTKISIICPKHGVFAQQPWSHLNGNKCKKCAIENNKILINEKSFYYKNKFIERANLKHGSYYDYSKINYINKSTKIEIICPKHGVFEQLPSNHLKNIGCSKCGFDKRKISQEEFINRARSFHGNIYDYSQVNYIGANKKITIICSIHGSFEQIASDHYTHGCNKCAMEFRHRTLSSNTENFIKEAQKIHKDKYDYSLVEYKNSTTKVKIICPKHGIFAQKPSYHLIGCDCPTCSKAGTSKAEKDWLDGLNILPENRQFILKIGKKKVRVDGYDPLSNTVYEYNGDFWHGNPKVFNPNDVNDVNKTKFGILYQKTLERENLIRSGNYNLVVKWETE